ncbi:MAG: Spy/CpxP family protein refolding chaperone [Planctomycetota bacterium]|nr:Spy/CpxP family protein refolding chaperone [Planctomycetota bacterium]
MTKRILIAAGLVAALAGGGAAALAQAPQPDAGIQRGPGAPGGRMRGPHGGRLGDLGLRGITLTDAQREQVRSIMESHQAEFEQIGSRLRQAHQEFAEAAGAESLDESALRARSTVVAAAMADEAILRARVRGEVRGILTAEQQRQLNELRANAAARAKERQQQRPRRQN